jgi:hypothetical protein
MTLERRQPTGDVGRDERPAAGEVRPEVISDDQLGAVDELGGVPRLLQRDTLAPTVAVVGLDAEQQDVAVCLHTEARPERGDEVGRDAAELEVAELEGIT